MTGLVLRLRPNEELMINGVLVQNGERKTNLRIKSGGAAILRMRDALRPEEATTPERRAYYIAQLAVAGQMDAAEARAVLERALGELADAPRDSAAMSALERAGAELAAGRLYGVMRRLRALMDDDAKAAAV